MEYHGTELERGKKAIENQMLPFSELTDRREQWLGDGIYLFKDIVYAYWWILGMHKFNIANNKYTNNERLYEKFTILGIEYECDTERIFDSEISDHYILFNKLMNYCNKRDKKIHKEGEIFNILFNEFGLKKEFDLVRWCYLGNTIDMKGARLKKLPQVQICIKRSDIIKRIKDIEKTDKNRAMENYEILFEGNENNDRYGEKMARNKKNIRWNV